MSELLFEIGTEEIPAGYIEQALKYMKDSSAKQFADLGLQFGTITTAATPRRLTLIVSDLEEKQADRTFEHVGPAVKAGFDANGEPTRAALGFAGSKGVTVESLQIVDTPKGKYLMAIEEVEGKPTFELLPAVFMSLVSGIVFPKSMRWADHTMSFARPIQWILALLDDEVVEFQLESVSSSNFTMGHRFMANNSIPVANGKAYEETLRQNHVIVDPAKRRELVISEVNKAVSDKDASGDAAPVLDEKLIDIVTNLVEIPWGICGQFDEKFLELPEEALITSMREHQKYFPVRGKDGKLKPLFVAVNNTKIEDLKLAANGHERVLRARLEDGLFFFHEDKKKSLEERKDDLTGIIFQQKLGTMLQKSERIENLSTFLAAKVAPQKIDKVRRAAQLAKADLLTEMVSEFPSLQGIIGREYALLDGEDKEVASAVYGHYLPIRAGGELPETITAAIVGIADRLDSIVGCFAIGEKPTGTTDPFGLRRLSLGLIHLIEHLGISVSLQELISQALANYQDLVQPEKDCAEQILDFIRLRFENDCTGAGTSFEVVSAATSSGFDDVSDTLKRMQALEGMLGQEQFSVLAGSYKRIKNIIKDNSDTSVDEALFSSDAEKQLYQTFLSVRDTALPLIEQKQYSQALETLLLMKEPVDLFFDEVMVMAEDQNVRKNRLNMLTALAELVLHVGDISKMHAE